MTSGGATPRRRLRSALGRALVLLSLLWLLLAAAFAARDHVAVYGLPSPMRLVFGDEVRVPRWEVLRRLVNAIRGPVRVGLQVGHLGAAEQPDELAELRYSTGAHWDGLDEVEANHAIVAALAERLRAHGFVVDVLPATLPTRYRADVLLSVHVDANPNEERSGYKSAHFVPARNPYEPLLKLHLDRAMLALTSLPDDDRNVTGNMLQYYAFNNRRYRHAAHARTPALIVELGYLSNPHDRELIDEPDRLAAALEAGVVSYLDAVGRL